MKLFRRRGLYRTVPSNLVDGLDAVDPVVAELRRHVLSRRKEAVDLSRDVAAFELSEQEVEEYERLKAAMSEDEILKYEFSDNYASHPIQKLQLEARVNAVLRESQEQLETLDSMTQSLAEAKSRMTKRRRLAYTLADVGLVSTILLAIVFGLTSLIQMTQDASFVGVVIPLAAAFVASLVSLLFNNLASFAALKDIEDLQSNLQDITDSISEAEKPIKNS